MYSLCKKSGESGEIARKAKAGKAYKLPNLLKIPGNSPDFFGEFGRFGSCYDPEAGNMALEWWLTSPQISGESPHHFLKSGELETLAV